MSSNPAASPTRVSTPWTNSVRVPPSPTNRPSDLQPTGASSPKYEQASSASPPARSPPNGQVYARPGMLSVPDPLPKLGSPYQGAPARNRRRMPGDLAEEGEEEGESADEGLRETEDDEADGEPSAHSPEYALTNSLLMSLSKPSPLPKLPQGPDKFELAMARRYSGRLSVTAREDGSSSEQPQASSVATRRHPGTARAPSASTLLVNTQVAQGQAAHAPTPVVSAHTTGRSATSKRLLPTVPPSPISTALTVPPTATSVSGVPSTPTTASARTSNAITSASPVVGLDISLGSSAGSLTDGGTDMCSTLGMSSGGFNLTSSTTGTLYSSTNSLDEARSQGSAFKTTTVLEPDKIQGEQAEGAGGGKGVPPSSPAASISGTAPMTAATPRSTSITTAQIVTATTAVNRLKKATPQGHLLSQTGRSPSSRVKSPPSVDTQAGEDRRATSRSGSSTSLLTAARSPKTLALTSRNALMHTTQHSILEDSEETGAEGAAEGEAENTGPEATAERQRLWLCIVSTLFSQQLLVCLLHRQGRQLESHCFLGMNILRSQWLHQLQVDRQHSMQQKMATCIKAIKLFRRYKGRMARRRFFSQMVLLRSFFNGPVYKYITAPQTRAVKILTVFLQEILEDKFLRRKLMRRLLYNIHKCQRYTRQYLACTAARMAGLRNYWDRVEATYHVKVHELIDLAAQVESDAIRMQLPSPLSSGDINTILPLLVAAMSPKSTPASPPSVATPKARAPLSITTQAPGAAAVMSPRGTQAVARHNTSTTPRSPSSANPTAINTDVGPTFTSGRPPSSPTATQRPSLTPSAAASAQRTPRNSSATFNNGPHHNVDNSPRNNFGIGTTPRLSSDGLVPQTPISAAPASEQSALKQEPPPRPSIAGSGSRKVLLSKEPPSPVSVASVSSPRGQPGASGLPTYTSMGTRIRVNPDIVAQLMPLGADCAIRDKQFALHMVRVHQQTALDKLAAFSVEPSIRDAVLSAYLSRRRSIYRGSLSKIVHDRLANRGQELTRVDTQLTLQDAYDFIHGRISERVGQALTSPLARKSQRVVVPVFRLYSSMSDQDMLALVKEGIAIQRARTAKHSAPLASEQSTPQQGP